MEFEERRERAIRLLEQSGIDRSSYAPPLMQLLWRCGVRVRPPHFMGFGAAALLSGAWFGIGWGLVMWVGFWSRHNTDTHLALLSAFAAGALYGLFMAGDYARQRKTHELPSWESLA